MSHIKKRDHHESPKKEYLIVDPSISEPPAANNHNDNHDDDDESSRPFAEPAETSSLIAINNNNNNNDSKTSYSTLTPKAENDKEGAVETHHERSSVNSKDDQEADATCCCDCCCDCWKEHRFTIMLALAVLVCLAVPLYFLVRHAHFEFDYHKECVTCFNDKADFEVIFNQTSGSCELYFQNETYDSNDIVLDPNFCGAPHCQNLELLPGLRLVPYWAAAVSAVFSIVLSVGVNLVKYNCYLPMKKRFVKWKWDEELVEENPIIRLSDEYGEAIREAAEKDAHRLTMLEFRGLRYLSIFLKTFGLTNPILFVFLFLFSVGHFIFCAHEVVTKPTFAHLNGWHKYQTIYGLFLNSGSIEVLWFWFSMAPLSVTVGLFNFGLGFDEKYSIRQYLNRNAGLVPEQLWEDASIMGAHPRQALMMPLSQIKSECLNSFLVFLYVGFAVLATMPVFFTHILPGVVLFIPYWSWILVALGIVYGPASGYFESSSSMFLPSLALLRIVGSFGLLLLFPIIFNWTVLFYESRTWSDVMTGEYRLRNTDCYFNAIVNNIQIYNVGFVGLIFS